MPDMSMLGKCGTVGPPSSSQSCCVHPAAPEARGPCHFSISPFLSIVLYSIIFSSHGFTEALRCHCCPQWRRDPLSPGFEQLHSDLPGGWARQENKFMVQDPSSPYSVHSWYVSMAHVYPQKLTLVIWSFWIQFWNHLKLLMMWSRAAPHEPHTALLFHAWSQRARYSLLCSFKCMK